MSKIFNRVPANKLKRNAFDLSHERKFSLNMGELVPIMCEEVVPGDTFRSNTEVLLRLAPLIAPVMHRVNVYTHFFFVPNRLIWNEWEDFITGGVDGQSSPVHPRFRFAGADGEIATKPGKLPDYLGIPHLPEFLGDETIDISQLPFRAYQLIYNEYYRDQTLIPEVEFSKGSGINDLSTSELRNEATRLLSLRRRAWEKDYFTSALPWSQRGGDVTIPMAGEAPVIYRNDDNTRYKAQTLRPALFDLTPKPDDGSPLIFSHVDSTPEVKGRLMDDVTGMPWNIDPSGTLFADMSQVTASTINDLRKAFQLQRWLERNARSGARYVESILAHFGVKSSDARLQRPEYLGGGKSPVMISEVLQTSETTENSPQANMSGHGISVGNSHSFKKFFEEHGYIIGIMSVMPRTAYQQGIPKMHFKFDKFDYFWPEFAHIGEQEIKNKELYVSTDNEYNEATFGYTPRYAEYKYRQSSVHGDFKNTLNFWHLGRVFENEPQLNGTFVEANPSRRIFAVEDENLHTLWCQIYNNTQAIRPMPVFGEPGLIDHG